MIFAAARVAGDGSPEITPHWRDALVSAGLVLAMGSVLIAMDPRVRRIGPQKAAAPPEKSSQIVAKLDPPVIAADEPAEVQAEDEALRAALIAFALSKVANPPPAEAPLPPQRAVKPVVARGAKQPHARAVSAPAKRLRPAEWREPPRPPAGRPGWLQAADPRHLITLASDRQRLAQNVTALARTTSQTLNAGVAQAQKGAAQAARIVSEPVTRLLR